MMNTYTLENIIALAKEENVETTGFTGNNIPVLTFSYSDHLSMSGLNAEDFESPNDYIRNVSYADKRQVFTDLGMKVQHMSLTATKLINAADDLNAAFSDGKTNAVIIQVNLHEVFDAHRPHGELYFLLEFPVNGDPLIDYVISKEALDKQKETSQLVTQMFENMRKNRNKQSNSDLPF